MPLWIDGVQVWESITLKVKTIFKAWLGLDNSLGGEKATNGAFAADTDWTKTTGWAIASGVASHNDNGTGTLSQNVSAVADQIYRVAYTVSNWTVGTVTVAVGGVSGTARGVNGTYIEYIKATGTGNLTFTPTNTARFDIDNVSVKLVAVAAADRATAWVDDQGGTAGKGSLYVMSEDGTVTCIGGPNGIEFWPADTVPGLKFYNAKNHLEYLQITWDANIVYLQTNKSGAGSTRGLDLGTFLGGDIIDIAASGAINLNTKSNQSCTVSPNGTGAFKVASNDGAGTPVAPDRNPALFYHTKDVVDDGIVTLKAVTSHGFGTVLVGTDVAVRTQFFVDSTGTVTLLNNTASVVANADTDTNLCIGTAATQEPLQIKNRLGATKPITVTFVYD